MVVTQQFPLVHFAEVYYHPQVYWMLLGDAAPKPGTIDLQGTIDDSSVEWWLVYENGTIPVGFHSARDTNGVCWEVSSAFVPSARGSLVTRSATHCLAECARKYGAKKFFAEVAEDNKPALSALAAVGFEREGVNARSFLRRGRLIDQIRMVKWSE